jgi:arsenate reductase
MSKERVLFVCVHNSARSQIAEALMNRYCGDAFEAHSAGLEPGTLNALAVAALAEVGIDIRGKPTRGVFDLFRAGERFAYVITVCDEASAERCPVFPGVAMRLHWGFPDPSALAGSWEDKLRATREIRDAIEVRIREFCGAACAA